jgi:hypothetical protein
MINKHDFVKELNNIFGDPAVKVQDPENPDTLWNIKRVEMKKGRLIIHLE